MMKEKEMNSLKRGLAVWHRHGVILPQLVNNALNERADEMFNAGEHPDAWEVMENLVNRGGRNAVIHAARLEVKRGGIDAMAASKIHFDAGDFAPRPRPSRPPYTPRHRIRRTLGGEENLAAKGAFTMPDDE